MKSLIATIGVAFIFYGFIGLYTGKTFVRSKGGWISTINQHAITELLIGIFILVILFYLKSGKKGTKKDN